MEAHSDLGNYDNLSVLEKIQLELNSKLETNIDQNEDLVEKQEDEDLVEQLEDDDLVEQLEDDDLEEKLEDENTLFNLDELSINDKIK